jgi:hypothetical protein
MQYATSFNALHLILAQMRVPPLCQGEDGFASAARPGPWLRQLPLAACQLTPAPAPGPHPQRHGLREARAALHASDGRGAA